MTTLKCCCRKPGSSKENNLPHFLKSDVTENIAIDDVICYTGYII